VADGRANEFNESIRSRDQKIMLLTDELKEVKASLSGSDQTINHLKRKNIELCAEIESLKEEKRLL
jgi:hypothetical protein